jgi:hypothetical protein
MAGIYYVEAADWMRAAGLTVVEVKGWQTRARSSGGFPVVPLGVVWHHTASQTSIENDTNWEYFGSDVAPIGNMTIARNGEVWLGAAGAANTQGRGGPARFSRGTVPADTGNSRLWAIEVSNNGTGEPWPRVQVDAIFTASNTLNDHFGNRADDVITHAAGTGNGWTTRKIDPAKASAVLGPWQPRAVTSSGTWSLDDLRAECLARAVVTPPEPPQPEPPAVEDDRMLYLIRLDTNLNLIVVGDGITQRRVRADELDELTNAVTKGIGPTYHNPCKPDRPIIRDMADIPTGSDDFLQLLGLETAESLDQPG